MLPGYFKKGADQTISAHIRFWAASTSPATRNIGGGVVNKM